jgi:transcriptional regulator with XRE-family HTH domain
MDECMGKDLAAARESAGMYQFQVGHLLHVSEDVIGNWERDKSIPTPDQVDELEKLYNAPGLWYGWMRFQFKSFRDRYPDSDTTAALALAMVNAGAQMGDVTRLQEGVIRDALDGKIDNERGFAEYLKQAKEAHAALGELLARAENE